MARLGTPYCEELREQNSCQCEACFIRTQRENKVALEDLQRVEVYRAKKDIAAAGPEPELLTLPGLSGYWSRSAGSDDDLGGRATAGPVWYGNAGFLSIAGRLAAAHS